jgi:hypothetical protein
MQDSHSVKLPGSVALLTAVLLLIAASAPAQRCIVRHYSMIDGLGSERISAGHSPIPRYLQDLPQQPLTMHVRHRMNHTPGLLDFQSIAQSRAASAIDDLSTLNAHVAFLGVPSDLGMSTCPLRGLAYGRCGAMPVTMGGDRSRGRDYGRNPHVHALPGVQCTDAWSAERWRSLTG